MNASVPSGTWGCVDIGGTKVAVSLAREVCGSVEWLGRVVRPTTTSGGAYSLSQQVLDMIKEVSTSAGISRLSGIGVASCGPFTRNAGMVELAAPNICGGLAEHSRGMANTWKAVPLEAPLRARFEHVRVENDGVAALEAERLWGALRGFSNCAYVTWSTGIGAGLCVDGRVLRGKNANAGHIGHMLVGADAGALCGCGNRDDVEALIAGSALPRRFGRDAASLVNAARAGDEHACEIVAELCRVLGRAIYNLVVTLDLEVVSFGGSVLLHHHDFLLPQVALELRGRLPTLTTGVQLVPAGLGHQVGDYAALALVAHQPAQA